MAIPSPGQILKAEGLAPKYSFGQNFLSDPRVARRIAEAAVQAPGRRVIEIGAGLGALTDHLLDLGSEVIAIERDRDLVPVLGRLFEKEVEAGKLRVVEADAKQSDWQAELARGASGAQGGAEQQAEQQVAPQLESPAWVIAGNLPYQITGALIEKTVELAPLIERAAFLVQKEVADRLAAASGSKTYGALSVFVQAQFEVKREFVVKGGAFIPPPKVESAVISLVPHSPQRTRETDLFRKVVKLAFLARRKKLKNAWKNLAAAEIVESAAERTGISLMQRAEELSVEQFIAFKNHIKELTGASE